MTRLAFHFDSSACSGCKACQAACKDKNHLPVGILWRRVYEVVGGGWMRQGSAWLSTVFAYNLSIGCNHCEHPVCMEVCPTAAYSRRPDGIVVLDSNRCAGCRYCVWVCPYGAPQYDEQAGVIGKCDFCVDLLDSGLPPSCVAACPMRALEFGDYDDLVRRHGPDAGVFPLPWRELTGCSLVITPHPMSLRAADGNAQVNNWEEIPSRDR
jgi:anaerobic dimethyl sulfoxide reductase subunit B (iron-sulfur subunit)